MSNKVNNHIIVESLPNDIEFGGSYIIAQANPNTYTHSFFKYPCRFIPEIPRWAIQKYLTGVEDACVFDPFAGSGTTLLESVINDYEAYGTEIDNIAKLIIKVKTTPFTKDKLEEIANEFNRIVTNIDTSQKPQELPGINNLDHWFTEDAIVKLSGIKKNIDRIDDKDIRDFFNICFVSIIKRVSNADDVSPKPYVSNKIKKNPPETIKEFSSTFTKYFEGIRELSSLGLTKKARIIKGDALNFEFDGLFDLAVTSPPYINAFDYARTMRLENLWLDTMTENELREKKKDYVGTESIKITEEEKRLEILDKSTILKSYYSQIFEKDKKRALIVKKFFEDMEGNLKNTYKYLKPGGHYMIVIGNSSIRKVEVESWKVIQQIAELVGFKTETYFNYLIQNPYIRIPRGNKGGKINLDHVLVLKKGE
ncbi:TPA: hypothetical protein OL468_003639 [Clostridioides difficile]|nr:hypothetical protein [Clostridioides difficile]HCQ6155171.1 hypothetical protein [Clostridioides difficile]